MERCPLDFTLMGEWTLQRPTKCRQRGSRDDVSKTGSSLREEDMALERMLVQSQGSLQ